MSESQAGPVEVADPPYIEEQYQRLAALLLTLPGWNRNYTSSVDAVVTPR